MGKLYVGVCPICEKKRLAALPLIGKAYQFTSEPKCLSIVNISEMIHGRSYSLREVNSLSFNPINRIIYKQNFMKHLKVRNNALEVR